MKKIFWTIFAVLVFAMPFSVIAALTRFPSNEREILQHLLENTDSIHILVDVWKTGEEDPFGGTRFHFGTYRKDDGTSESINAVARRSASEFEKLLERMLRAAVDASVNQTDISLVGQHFWLSYELKKNVRDINPLFPTFPLRTAYREITALEFGSEGRVVIPETVFAVDLSQRISAGEGGAFFVQNILKAELTVEDEHGKTIERWSSDSLERPRRIWIYDYADVLVIAAPYMLDPAYQRGKLTLSYRGGVEQVFNRLTGELIETTLPDRRAITALQRVYDGILLTIAAKEGEEVVIDYTPNLPRWEVLPSVAFTKATPDSRTYFHPTKGDRGFYQARVVPSTIRIR